MTKVVKLHEACIALGMLIYIGICLITEIVYYSKCELGRSVGRSVYSFSWQIIRNYLSWCNLLSMLNFVIVNVPRSFEHVFFPICLLLEKHKNRILSSWNHSFCVSFSVSASLALPICACMRCYCWSFKAYKSFWLRFDR